MTIGLMALAMAQAAPALPAATSFSASGDRSDQSARMVDPREDDDEAEDRVRDKKPQPRAERREKKGETCRRSWFTQRCRIGAAPSPFAS